MKKFVIALIFLIASFSYSQTKYYINFKDKGLNKNQYLNKTTEIFQAAAKLLSKRSIERRKRVMGNNYITYEDLPLEVSYVKSIENLGIKIQNKLRWFNSVTAYLTPEQKNEAAKLSFVKSIVPVRVISFKQPKINTNKSLLKNGEIKSGLDYGPSKVQDELSDIPIVQSKGITGQGVIVGILDDGFRWRKVDALKNRHVIAEYDFVFHDSVTANQIGDAPNQDAHGTSVFSIMAGYKPGQIIGPAYNASFILAKTEDVRSESHIEEDNYAAALQWMESLGVDITSSSLGYNIFDDTTYSYTYQDMNGKTAIVTKAADLAFQRGVVVLTAAGNEGNNKWHYILAPADGINVIAVGAVDNQNSLAYFSSHGPTADGRIKPDIVAMGVNDYAASVAGENIYIYGDGTSFATPIASGIAAMLKSTYPYLTNVQVRDILRRTAGNSDKPNNDIGWGLVSAEKAIAFPNIESKNNSFIMHKIFFQPASLNPATVKIHYMINGSDSIQSSVGYDDSLKYNFDMPPLSSGSNFTFFYTFQDSSGNSYRDPQNQNYSYYPDSSITLVNLNSIALYDEILQNNYPNPFNTQTRIFYKVLNDNHVKLIIFNTLGEKIKTLVDRFMQAGEYNVVWDGRNENAVKCASGIYTYYLLVGNKEYMKKMVLLH